jgi:hypothetical protein
MQIRKATLAIALALVSTSFSPTVLAQPPTTQYWAVIAACAYAEPYDLFYETNLPLSADAHYLYHILTEHYKFDGIYYLDINPLFPAEVNDTATRDHFRWAITNWLRDRSDANDVIFIYIGGHGGGYNTIENELEGGRIDGSQGDPVDEGQEHFNGTSWFGVDECFQFRYKSGTELYWDDELAQDLSTLQYSKLIFIRIGCGANGTENVGCFSGGIIDDISAPNRIIMTDANETYYGFTDLDGDGFSEWAEAFMDALHGEDTYFITMGEPLNQIGRIVHNSSRVNADFDGDGRVSMWEAWQYAWDHDDARTVGYNDNGVTETETPWFDDDGDGLPTYVNGADHLDLDQGSLAKQTFLVPSQAYAMKTGFTREYSQGYGYVPNVPGVNRLQIKLLYQDSNLQGDCVGPNTYPLPITRYPDGKVDTHDLAFVSKRFGTTPSSPIWDYLADVNADGQVETKDAAVVSKCYGKTGSYRCFDMGVYYYWNIYVWFDKSLVVRPDPNGFVAIPKGAKNFTVFTGFTPIGAVIEFHVD